MRYAGFGLALLMLAVLTGGTASARAEPVIHPPALAWACVGQTSARSVRLGDAQARSTGASALHQYDDYIEDVVTAPDVCGSNVVTNDNVAITMAIHVHDRSGFEPEDAYSIHLDIDGNPATGASEVIGPVAGVDYVIDVADEASRLRSWNGSTFEDVVPQPAIPSGWIEDYGPVLRIARTALGNPTTFKLVIATANAGDVDFAPDSGAWSYVVAPLALTVRAFLVSPARAGTSLHATMVVLRSDWDMPLDQGAVSCRATLTGRKLVGRGRFEGAVVACSWRIPATARGKRVRGRVAVTFQGVTASRRFSVRVR